jgi:hypothetical protein
MYKKNVHVTHIYITYYLNNFGFSMHLGLYDTWLITGLTYKQQLV